MSDLIVCVGGANATKDAPTGAVVGTSDAQTLTNKVFGDVPTTTDGIGAVNGDTVSAVESAGFIQKTTITLASTPVSIASDDTTTIGYGGVKIYDFPDGFIRILGASLELTIAMDDTQSAYFTDATPEGDIAIGSTIANSAEALGSSDTSDDDIVGAVAWTAAAYAVATAVTGSFDTAPASLDGTSSAIDANLNVTVDATELTADDPTLEISGTVIIYWINESV